MIKTLKEFGRWKAFKADATGRQIGIAGYGSSLEFAIASYEQQAFAVRNATSVKSRW